MIIVIGRGHSGTRAVAHTLQQSGVYMGDTNHTGDMRPFKIMYDACNYLSRFVEWTGHDWDFSQLHDCPIPIDFINTLNCYLRELLTAKFTHVGFKLPETLFCLPWLVRLYPHAHYIYWVRDPRDVIKKPHLSDSLNRFGIYSPVANDVYHKRALSWWYQYRIVEDTPKPKNWLTVRFEDFVQNQDYELERLENYLNLHLAKIPVFPERAYRWQKAGGNHYPFLEDALNELGYLQVDRV